MNQINLTYHSNMQDPFFNILSDMFMKMGPMLKRDFNELFFVNKNNSTFCAKIITNACNILYTNLLKTNQNNGFILINDTIKIIKNSSNDLWWIIKPFDGMENFKHNLPFFGTIVVLVKKYPKISEISAAAFYNPISDELFFAKKGLGASLNARKIRAKAKSIILIAGNEKQCNRHLGCSALHFAYFAINKFDCVVENNLDIACKTFAQLITNESNAFFYENDNIVTATTIENIITEK